MIKIKRFLLLVLTFFLVSLITTKTAQAIDLPEFLTAEDSTAVRIQEAIEYFFTFKNENKVAVLEKHAEKRLVKAQDYAEVGNQEKVQNVLQNYLQIKEKQHNLLGKVENQTVLEGVAERTIEQQKTIEQVKAQIDGDEQQQIIQVQEQVVNQVAKDIVEVSGEEGKTEFFGKVEHVWAPGTGSGGGEAGLVIEGGGTQWAPGTGPGGGEAGLTVEGGGTQWAPGTGPGGGNAGVVVEGNEIKFATN